MIKLIAAISIFLISYGLIITEAFSAPMIALCGASLMSIFGIISGHEFVKFIDFEVIFLIAGMMIMVHIISDTGIFDWVAIKVAKLVRGEPFYLLIFLSMVTAVLSSFLDNVTTIIAIIPVTIFLSKFLEVSPVPYIISQTIASNIGGAATMIGDPPNLLIASQSGLTFNDFLFHLTPVIIINLIAFVFLSWVFFRKKVHVNRDKRAMIMDLDSSTAIKKPVKLIKSSIIFALVIFGFLTHDLFKIPLEVTSIFGAAIMVLVTKTNPEDVWKKVDWDTIAFFIGLFVMVGAIKKVGILKDLSMLIINLTRGNIKLTATALLWVSGIVSAFLDNIPYTATIAPMVRAYIIPMLSFVNTNTESVRYAIWWSLSLGACLGGNGTLVGASANIVAAHISKKNGYEISFCKFTKYGIVYALVTLAISNVYIWLRYL